MTYTLDDSLDAVEQEDQSYQEWLELLNHPALLDLARRAPDRFLKNAIDGLQSRGHPEWLERAKADGIKGLEGSAGIIL